MWPQERQQPREVMPFQGSPSSVRSCNRPWRVVAGQCPPLSSPHAAGEEREPIPESLCFPQPALPPAHVRLHGPRLKAQLPPVPKVCGGPRSEGGVERGDGQSQGQWAQSSGAHMLPHVISLLWTAPRLSSHHRRDHSPRASRVFCYPCLGR